MLVLDSVALVVKVLLNFLEEILALFISCGSFPVLFQISVDIVKPIVFFSQLLKLLLSRSELINTFGQLLVYVHFMLQIFLLFLQTQLIEVVPLSFNSEILIIQSQVICVGRIDHIG